MRIAHVTSTFPPYHGGTGTVCFYNALHLAKLGHRVHVYTVESSRDWQWQDVPGIHIHRLRALFRIGNAPFLPQLLRLRGFDLVHIHSPFPFAEEMLFLQSRRGLLRYVVTYHQDLILRGAVGILVRWHSRAVGQRVLMQAERVLATSLDYARASRIAPLVRNMPAKVVEMPNGVDVTRFRPGMDHTGLRERYRLGRGELVVLFVGALDRAHYFKGVDVLLQAVARLDVAGVRLLLIGDGNLRATYQGKAAALGLQEQVVFCGGVSDLELPLHYAASDLLVLPSTTMGEAFGVVLLEAMASGKPVVASNLPGVRSVITDRVDGLLVRPGDVDDLATKLLELLEDPRRRGAMGRCGRTKVEAEYDWPRIILRLERVYTEVLRDG